MNRWLRFALTLLTIAAISYVEIPRAHAQLPSVGSWCSMGSVPQGSTFELRQGNCAIGAIPATVLATKLTTCGWINTPAANVCFSYQWVASTGLAYGILQVTTQHRPSKPLLSAK